MLFGVYHYNLALGEAARIDDNIHVESKALLYLYLSALYGTQHYGVRY